jgi:hypothetical protein
LGNKFLFYVDHMALLYLIIKLQMLGWIVRRLLLFMEYNFLVVYKPRHFHSMVDVFSQLLDVTKNPEYLTRLLTHHCFYFN